MSSQKRSWPYANSSLGCVLLISSCIPARKRAWSSLEDRIPIEDTATVAELGIPSKQKSNVSGAPQHAVGMTSTPLDCQYAPHQCFRYTFQI